MANEKQVINEKLMGTRNYFGGGMSMRSQHKYKRIIIV